MVRIGTLEICLMKFLWGEHAQPANRPNANALLTEAELDLCVD